MRMTGSEAALEALRAEGITMLPGLVGSAFMDLLDIVEKAGIRFIPVRHEATAGFMAQGMARATGRAAVCIGQNGPGVTNLVTAVRDAYLAHTPIVAITPSTSTAQVGTDAIQELDAMALFAPIVGYQVRVPRPARMVESFQAAFRAAYAFNRPAQVDVPRDYFNDEIDIEIASPKEYRGASLGAGDAEALAEAARLLSEAKFPVIISGWGIVNSNGIDPLRQLAEWLSIPVTTTYLHNDAFPPDHPLACGPLGYGGSKSAMRVLAKADVILAAGARISDWGELVPRYDMKYFPQDARIIQIDVDPMQLGRTSKLALGIWGDARASVTEILKFCKELGRGNGKPTDRAPMVAAERMAWKKERAAISSSTATPLSPRRVLAEIEKTLPEDVIVTTDIGNLVGVACDYLKIGRPRGHIATLGFGGVGGAYGLALGAKLASPKRPVVAMMGDGGWGFSLVEVITAVQQDIPVTAIILDNSQWGAEMRNQVEWYDNRFVGTVLKNPDYAQIAKLMGAEAVHVETVADLNEALPRAFASDRPWVVHVVVDSKELGESFRRDIMKSPTRILERYREKVTR